MLFGTYFRVFIIFWFSRYMCLRDLLCVSLDFWLCLLRFLGVWMLLNIVGTPYGVNISLSFVRIARRVRLRAHVPPFGGIGGRAIIFCFTCHVGVRVSG